MNFEALIAAVKNEGGFDTTTGAVSDDTIKGWLNDALRTLVAESQWIKALVELGPTAADEPLYLLPENVLDVREVIVDGKPFGRVGAQEVFAARAYGGYVSDGWGVFAPGYNAAGQAVVELFPTPSEAGLAVKALAVISAVAMSANSDSPSVPEDFHPALKAKAIATGLRLIYERHDDADRWEREFDDPQSGRGAVQRLKRRANSRVGSGPIRVRIVG